MPDLTELAKQHILRNTEVSGIEAILLSIEFEAIKHKKDRPAITEYSRLKRSLITVLNQSH